ncbi:MAG: hypothetical protein LBU88_02330 [Treponema sp.]|jgi:hypothetical protein|nr:hypothetical protein [Treponema sp.]
MNKLIILSFIFIGLLFSCFGKLERNDIGNNKNSIENISENIQFDENDIFHVFSNKNSILINYEMFPNYKQYNLIFYNINGIEFNRQEIYGEYRFIFLNSVDKFVASQHATLLMANESHLFDYNGNLLFSFIHDYDNKQTEITNDNNYILFISNRMRPLREGEEPLPFLPNFKPYNHVIVYNISSGLLEKTIDFDDIIDVFIEINGKIYSILLLPADVPG